MKSVDEELCERISNIAIQMLETRSPMDFQILLGKLLEQAETLKLRKQS